MSSSVASDIVRATEVSLHYNHILSVRIDILLNLSI